MDEWDPERGIDTCFNQKDGQIVVCGRATEKSEMFGCY
jgi:hypothetical protein